MIRKAKLIYVFLCTALMFTGCSEEQATDESIPIIAPTLTIDFNMKAGEIKPVNGINNGPKSHSNVNENEVEWGLDATQIYKDLEIPVVRTHDTEYPDGSDYFVDIHCIFPDMSRDPGDETAYNFAGTDAYIANILESGATVFYRLGESIAPSVEEVTYQNPPEDYQKWADVCDHIIAHYNAGWNNGFNYDIQYWEIWNEPDAARQWTGNSSRFFRLASLYR